MNELQLFNYEEKPVRAVTINGEPWWIAKDICYILDITNSRDALQRIDQDDVCLTDIMDSVGRNQKTNIINESGLYSLVIQSRKPEAKKFKKWITSEVLPSIRKTGQYSLPKSDDELILIGYEKLLQRVSVLTEENKTLDIRVKKLIHDPKTYTTTEIAKELQMRSAQELNEKLKDKGVQYKVNNTWVLASEYSEKGYTETKQLEKDGVTIYNTQWTGAGRQFILEIFSGDNQRCA